MDDTDGWVRGPALEIVMKIRPWQEGDVVEVDIPRWIEAQHLHGWAQQSERVGVIKLRERSQTPMVVFPTTQGWATAYMYITGWKPCKKA